MQKRKCLANIGNVGCTQIRLIPAYLELVTQEKSFGSSNSTAYSVARSCVDGKMVILYLYN